MPRFLKPSAFCEAVRREGVSLSEATLATKRARDPEAIPFRKIGGRIYYQWPEAFLTWVGEGQTGAAAADGR
jgi:hypothetical protein